MPLPNVELRLLAFEHRHEVGTTGDLARGVMRLMDELNIYSGELLEAVSEDVDVSAWDVITKIETRRQAELGR